MHIITKLKIKITVAIVIILSIIFGLIVFAINYISYKTAEHENQIFLQTLIERDGVTYSFNNFRFIPQNNDSTIDTQKRHFTPNVPNSTWENRTIPNTKENYNPSRRFFNQPFENQSIRNYFTVRLNNEGKILKIISDFPLHYTDSEIQNWCESIFSSDKKNSTYHGIRYMIVKKPYGYLVACTEVKTESNLRTRLISISLQIYAISLIVGILVAWFFASWAVKPVKSSFEKQRRFVADASHELKTPLSVISANIDVLASEIGDNKWIDYIKTESNRMNSLIKDLLYLAKTDDIKEPYNPLPFDLSRTVMSTVLPFESVAYDQGKTLETDIQENVQFLGVQARIEQLLLILIDNAIKHSEEHAIIKVSLKMAGSKKIITVYNSGDGIKPENINHIFERFYRVDSSRNRNSGGFGLGLSIAQSIVQMHHGKIQVSSEVGKFTQFEVVL